jgi:hypothetical protein
VEYLCIYLGTGWLLLLFLTGRRYDPEQTALCWAMLLWPITLLMVVVWRGVELLGWCLDFARQPSHLSRFGTRGTDDGWPGVAIRGFGFEIRIWKDRSR